MVVLPFSFRLHFFVRKISARMRILDTARSGVRRRQTLTLPPARNISDPLCFAQNRPTTRRRCLPRSHPLPHLSRRVLPPPCANLRHSKRQAGPQNRSSSAPVGRPHVRQRLTGALRRLGSAARKRTQQLSSDSAPATVGRGKRHNAPQCENCGRNRAVLAAAVSPVSMSMLV